MPYKDPEIRRVRGRERVEAYRKRHRGRPFIGSEKPAPLCVCGCGKPAKPYVNPDGTLQSYRKYADGCAPYEKYPPKIPSEVIKIAYAAGIIDGDGCIQAFVRRTADGRLINIIKVSVSMCSRAVPQWLRDNFGGSLRRYPGHGNNPRLRDMWELSGRKALPFLEAITPFLVEKQQQGLIAQQLLSMVGKWGSSHRRTPEHIEEERIRLSEELKRLKIEGMNPIQIQ